MKHFRKAHGLNTGLTFLAVLLAMTGMFFLSQHSSRVLAAGSSSPKCGSDNNLGFETAPVNLCINGTGDWTDQIGNDGIWDWTCTNIGSVDCLAYRLRTGTIGGGSTASGDTIRTTGTNITYTGGGLTGSLTISGIDNIEVTSGTWNGILIPPTIVTGTNAATGGEQGIATEAVLLLTIQVGSTGAGLQANGGYFIVEFTVANGYPGQILKLYRSENGNTWIPNTPDDSCTLDAQLLCRFRTDHLSFFTVGAITWDTMNYLSPTFWAQGPGAGHIIAALYGTGGGQTAYTQNRSGRNGSQCDLTGMTIQYVGPGTGTIPQNLSGNTIYVLTGGNYITTGAINLSGCSAIVGQTGSYLYSTGYLVNGMIVATTGQYIILDNLNINGAGGGIVPNHTGNNFGVELLNSNNNTLNNIQAYNNNGGFLGFGIALAYNSNNNTLNNIQAYNNNQGILLAYNSNNNTLNNIQAYNNAGFLGYGVGIGNSDNNILNNIQAYNNNYGIYLITNSDNNILNNIQAYNNAGVYGYGVELLNSNNNTLNNIQAYNNSRGIFLDPASTGNKYYGNIKLFGNTTDIGGSGELLIAGSPLDLTGLSVTAGTISTGTTLSRGHLSNPRDASSYLLTRTTGFSSLRGQFTGRLGTLPITYSIGGYTPLQTQPVKRNAGNTGFEYYGLSGTNFSTGGADRYLAQYIGSDVVALTGNMTLTSPYTTINGQMYSKTGNLTVNILSTGADYVLSGNFTGGVRIGTFTAGTNISTGITVTSDGLKAIILQLGTGNTWATHYGFNVIVDTTAPTFTGIKANGTSFTSGQYLDTTGVQFTGSDTNFSGMTLDNTPYTGTRITAEGPHTFTITDFAGNSTGTTFTIDTLYPAFAGVTNESVTITGGNNIYTTTQITLSRNDTNISGATITGMITFSSTANGSKILTGEGGYTLTVTDKAGHSTGITFNIITPLIPTITLSGPIIVNSISYVKGSITLSLSTNKTASFIITGDLDPTTLPGNIPQITGISTSVAQSKVFSLTGGDGVRGVYLSFQTGTLSYGTSFLIYLDTTGPIITNALPPNNPQPAFSGDVTFGRSSVDAGIGTSGYYYYVSNTGTFTTYITSGFTISITKVVPYTTFLSSGTYYRYAVAVDKLNNRGITGATRSFDYIATVDSEPDSFSFNSITDAETDTAYMSNTITIAGLTLNAEVPVSIDNGVLYISGIVVGRTGTVKQGDTVKIELMSSSEVDHKVTSTLTIGSLTPKFSVTTSTEGTETTTLSSTTKLNVITVFDTIADLYEDNKGKQGEFMVTFKSMLNDLIDEMEDDSLNSSEKRKLAILKYLLDLTEQFIDDNDISDGDIHTAPNGKRYIITYDSAKACYTSPNFLTPNKCFPSLDVMKSYINSNNLARTHTVDTARTTPSYMAPNGKTYTILKTTDGRYFSYRFISPKYFNSLQAAKDYIKKNNPKGKGR